MSIRCSVASALLVASLTAQASDVRHINPDGMPKPAGYTHVVEVNQPGRMVFLSGQLGIDAHGKLPDDLRAEFTQLFDNIRTALRASGADFKDVVRIEIYLTDMQAQLPAFREIRDHYIDTTQPPASTAVEIRRLTVPNAHAEVTVTAVLPSR